MDELRQPFATKTAPSQRAEGRVRGLPYAIVGVCALITIAHAWVGRSGVFLFLDEFHSLANLDRDYASLLSLFDAHGSGLALPLLQRFARDLLGEGLQTDRIPAALGALGAILLCYPVGKRWVGPVPALISVFALCNNSLFIYYSRVGRSYSLAVLLVLWLAFAIQTAISTPRPDWRRYAWLAVTLGFTPYVHLATLGVEGAMIAAAAAILIVREDGSAHARPMIVSVAGGILVALILHLPALGAISSFLGGVVQGRQNEFIHDPSFVWIAAEILAGGPAVALVFAIGIPVAAIRFLIVRRSEALLLVAAAVSSPIVVALLAPRGAPVAWARYMLISLPFLLMLLAWGITDWVRRLPMPRPAANRLALVAGGILVLTCFMGGPLGVRHVDDGPFSNGYLSTRSIPANDVPWPGTPGFYRNLAATPKRERIIEVPILTNRRVYLYRNYYLQHRGPVWMGTVDSTPDRPRLPTPPYVSILDPEALAESDADYLVIHLNVQQEAAEFEAFVAATRHTPHARRSGSPSVRHGLDLSGLARALGRELGVPTYRDRKIVAWALKPARS